MGALDIPTTGTYFLKNVNISNYTEDQLAEIRNKEIGFVFQTFNLLPRTSVYENIKLPLIYSGIKQSQWDGLVRKAIKDVGLEHRAEHEPSQLSGGEKQRVAIARALVNNPRIIFADEPTGNLDSKSGAAVMEILQTLNQKNGHTIILITHETYTAETAKRIISIKDGLIVSDRPVTKRVDARDGFVK